MGLWGKVDNVANTVIYAPALRKRKANTANSAQMFANTTTTGVFAIDANEMNANEGKIAHAGWILRTVGTGGRAGRVQYETLVAMGSITGDTEDVATPNVLLAFTTQPVTKSVAAPAATTFVVVATATPSETITYQWQLSTGGVYTNIVNGGVYSTATTATLNISNTTGLSGNRYRCVISSASGGSKNSNPAILTVT